ncbi:MAG: TA system VapC family ribonuclease toxin [Bryobacteraceae bacterium]|nr:TA system VapC family ribonuclease toxin [Bryobacteraceae bacterium]
MILVDANLLIYSRLGADPRSPRAAEWLDDRINSGIRVGLPWASLTAFLRVTTNARIQRRPIAFADAWQAVQEWLAVDNVWIPNPTLRHQAVLAGLWPHVSHSDLVMDAHLAALAIEHGLTLCSADGDFARFPGLRWENPLLDQ